jgi:hypothetical protein
MISKLISLSKMTVLLSCFTVCTAVQAGYYIQYMRDPCVNYEACDVAQHHARYVTPHRHHFSRNHHYHRHSSYAISVNYYWNMYPTYGCSEGCQGYHPGCGDGFNDSSRGRPVEYRESDYNSSYYSAYSDVDYDTSTADDMTRRSENY